MGELHPSVIRRVAIDLAPWVFGGMLLVLLQACTSPAVRAPVEDPAHRVPTTTIPVKKMPVEAPPALKGLLALAEQHYREGDWPAAIAVAERGLRIERRSAAFYLVLAKSYLQLGIDDRAEEFAQQGMRYAEPGESLWRALDNIQRGLVTLPAEDAPGAR